MSPIERLPPKIPNYVLGIRRPPEKAFVSKIDEPRYKCGGEWQYQTYARYHAAFARTSRHFHDILNEQLYTRNLSRDPDHCSCLFWAVGHNRLETIKRARQYGADLSSYGLEKRYNGYYNMKVNGVLMPLTCLKLGDKMAGSPLYDAVSSGFEEINTNATRTIHLKQPCDWDTKRWPISSLNTGPTAPDRVYRHFPLLSPRVSRALSQPFSREMTVSLVGKLLFGALTDDLELVMQCLEDSRVDVNAKDIEGNSALHLAINSAGENLDLVRFLLRRRGIDTSIPNEAQCKPIHLAVLKGRVDIVRLFEDRPLFSIGSRTGWSESALHMAAQAASKELFFHFLNHPDFEYPEGEDLRRLEHLIAGSKGDVQAKAFLQALVDAELQLKPTRSTPGYAIQKGNLLTASKLLSLISNDDLLGSTQRNRQAPPGRVVLTGKLPLGPLHCALMKQHDHVTTLVRELLERGVDTELPANSLDGAVGDCKAKPLFFAAAFAQNTDCMKMLLEAGADATSTTRVRVSRKLKQPLFRTMSLLSGLLSYVWRDRTSIVEYPVQHPSSTDSPIQEDMFELENRVLLLLRHGATLNKFGDGPSALGLVCNEAAESSSLNFLKWVIDNATTGNVSTKHVDSVLSEFALVKDMPVQREIHNMLKRLKERLLRDRNQD
ncbi:unnamed protein product [Clonostachys solani]|uniref:Uncharacterized protein n=1 Tax=Clonostachys solani TaxID=160281 RepID=A0A9N9WBY4_9HYPO|nr:unnamed protein product [Clonostachys solani]